MRAAEFISSNNGETDLWIKIYPSAEGGYTIFCAHGKNTSILYEDLKEIKHILYVNAAVDDGSKSEIKHTRSKYSKECLDLIF